MVRCRPGENEDRRPKYVYGVVLVDTLKVSDTPSDTPEIGAVKPKRDERLDFWRGLCLIDMILVHLAYYDEVQFSDFFRGMLTDYTRFAAGGFVFLSGLCLGIIFLPRAIKAIEKIGNPFAVYRKIWARASKIYIVQIFSSLLLTWFFDPVLHKEFSAHPVRFLFDLVCMRRGNDLLLLYVCMLALSPAMLELIRRRLWLMLALISMLVFRIGMMDPYRFAFIKPFATQPGGKFPVLLWQMVFVSGMLCTRPLAAFDRARQATKLLVLSVIGVLATLIILSAYPDLINRTTPIIPLTYIKVPLSIGEYFRYTLTTLLIMLVTDATWKSITGIPFFRFICMLGRNSLFVYVAHLFMQEMTIMIALKFPGDGHLHLVLGIGMIAILGILAYVAEKFMQSMKQSRQPDQGRLAGSATVGAVVGDG